MELGVRLRQARLEAGLSQRQLCGDTVTRNMLSQIENGSARPSMDTLRILAQRLGKPMSYFWEEHAVTSPNQELMAQARQALPNEALSLLKHYRAPDPVFDRERYLLEALSCMDLAGQVYKTQPGYAATLLQQASQAGAQTPYYTPELERRRLLLCYEAGAAAGNLAAALPEDPRELLLRAQAALDQNQAVQACAFLSAIQQRTAKWYELQGDCCFAQQQYSQALENYRQAPPSPRLYSRMEECCRELEDYKMAYFYACKLRQD